MKELTVKNTYALAMLSRKIKQQWVLRRFKGCTVRCRCHEKALWSMQVLEDFQWVDKGYQFCMKSVHDVCVEARDGIS